MIILQGYEILGFLLPAVEAYNSSILLGGVNSFVDILIDSLYDERVLNTKANDINFLSIYNCDSTLFKLSFQDFYRILRDHKLQLYELTLTF